VVGDFGLDDGIIRAFSPWLASPYRKAWDAILASAALLPDTASGIPLPRPESHFATDSNSGVIAASGRSSDTYWPLRN